MSPAPRRAPRGTAPLLALLALVLALAVGEAGMRLRYAFGSRHEMEFTRYSLLFKTRGPTPDLPFEHRPGVTATLMGVELRTNADGLRGAASRREAPPGTLRIACVGDSLTLGWGVTEDETFCRQLARRVGAAEGLNFGVGNYNTAMQLQVLRAKVFEHRPGVVVLQYYINDAEPTPRYSESVFARSHLAVFLWARVDLLLRRAGVREDYVAYYRALYEDDRPGYRAFRDAVRDVAAECRSRGVPLVVVVFPEMHRFDDAEPFQAIYAGVEGLWRAERVPVVNLWERFRGQDPRQFWVHPADVHPNGRAFAVAAEATAAALVREVRR